MIVIVFGVSGAGKSVIGNALAAELGWAFYDADLFHPEENIEKMKRGIALTDADREPWLESLCGLLQGAASRGENAVLACSALKESYRRALSSCAEVRLVFLKGDYDLISRRLGSRQGHFMGRGLLRSQFEILEEPREGTLVVDIRPTPAEIARTIRRELGI